MSSNLYANGDTQNLTPLKAFNDYNGAIRLRVLYSVC